MISIIGIIYLIGSVIALIIGIVEIIRNHSIEDAQYGMICGMIILSWITVILYVFNKIKYKTIN